MQHAPFVIGGGEIAQSVWFELKGLGVSSPIVLMNVITAVGNHIYMTEKEVEQNFDAVYRSNLFGTKKEEHKSAFYKVFVSAFYALKQFIHTNVPKLVESKQQFILGYSGGSLTVQTV